MKLLIITQVVDNKDDNLGFFHRWIAEFAASCEEVSVICLRKGAYELPNNVHIYSLGKEEVASRITRVWRFYRYIFTLRKSYDAVFVHMNPEYIVLGGWWWRLWHKKVMLWYTHKSVDLKLRVAEKFANIICTASKESFRLPSKKVHILGHGIDTEFFTPDAAVVRGEYALSVGRLMKSKRHDLAIELAKADGRELHIAGAGPERAALEELAAKIGARVIFLGPLTQVALRDEYRRAAYVIHTSETGSLDKVVLEALACGCPVHTRDPYLKDLPLNPPSPQYVREQHSLKRLIPLILSLYAQ